MNSLMIRRASARLEALLLSVRMNPLFLNKDGSLKTFDYAVANPPFSYKSWRNGFDPQHDLHDRFAGYGIPTRKKETMHFSFTFFAH
jgi:type I restriction enzyme M protein